MERCCPTTSPDIARTCRRNSLRRILNPGARIHYIVGNSTFYGVLVSTERIYETMFREYGFANVAVSRIRKRNSKKELIIGLVAGPVKLRAPRLSRPSISFPASSALPRKQPGWVAPTCGRSSTDRLRPSSRSNNATTTNSLKREMHRRDLTKSAFELAALPKKSASFARRPLSERRCRR